MITKEEISKLFQHAEECKAVGTINCATAHKVAGAIIACYTEVQILGVPSVNDAYFAIQYPKSHTWVWFKMPNCVKDAHFWHMCSYSTNTGKTHKGARRSMKETDRLRSFINKLTGNSELNDLPL